MGVIPIIIERDFSSCAFGSKLLFKADDSEKPYKLDLSLIKYGGCSLMVERVVVVRKTRVRFSPSALLEKRGK